jgi:hypothetical protein
MQRLRRVALVGLIIGSTTTAIALGAVAASSAVKPSFLITPTALAFGPVATGSTAPSQAVTIKNMGSDSVVMSGAGGNLAPPFTADLSNCEGATLAPGGTCQMVYTFAPEGVGDAIATATGFWNGKKYIIKLSGAGVVPTFNVSPAKINFGPVLVGKSAPPQVVSVTNVSPTPILMSGTGLDIDAPYGLTEDCSGVELAPGQVCHMTYTFQPTEVGKANATSMPNWNGQTTTINLTGSGVGPTVLISPTALQFGNVATGTSAPLQTVTVTNLSPFPLVMSGTGGGVSTPFTKSENCTGKTLNYGQTCQMTFGFHPTVAGRASATSLGTWNGVSYSIKLLGTGV